MNTLSKFRSALLTVLALSFISVFSTGCDSSTEDFVNTQVFNSGNLAFNLQRESVAQVGADTVPDATTSVRVDLFSDGVQNDTSFLLTETFPFSGEVITVQNAPLNVQSVLITAFDADGLPLGTMFGNVTVIPGGTASIDLNDLIPATFNSAVVAPDPVNLVIDVIGQVNTDSQQITMSGDISGQTFDLPVNANAVTFTVANAALVEVSPTGVVSTTFVDGAPGGNTTVTANYTFLGTQRSDTFIVNVRNFSVVNGGSNQIVQGEAYTENFGIGFFDNTGVQQDVANQVTFALEAPVDGVTITEAGVIQTSATSPLGDFNVVATFVDDADGASGLTFTDVVPFSITEALTMEALEAGF